MLDGRSVDHCGYCYDAEARGVISRRQHGIRDMLDHAVILESQVTAHQQGQELKPFWYGLKISNNCNLGCIMCDHLSSSTIAAEMGIDDPHLSREPDVNINPNTVRIYMAGGEPFMIKKYAAFLERIENRDCEIVINTNGTIITRSMVDALAKFNNVNITLSVDGFGDLNSQIRRHSQWSGIESNLSKFKELGYTIHVNTTVQKDNINHLLPLGEWIAKNQIQRWTLSELVDPEGLRWYHCDQLDVESLITLRDIDSVKNDPMNVRFVNSITKRWQKKNQ